MNLIFALLVSRQYLTKEQIRESIADYRDSTPQAFDRKFERDKEELRELGITVEMGSIDKYFNDEPGYRHPPRRGRAARSGADPRGGRRHRPGHPGVGARRPGRRLHDRAGQAQGDRGRRRHQRPADGRAASCRPTSRRSTRCGTPRPGASRSASPTRGPASEPMLRHLQPWGIVSWRDRWYVGGFDLDRGEPRIFRLSRVDRRRRHRGCARVVRDPRGHRHEEARPRAVPAAPEEAAVLRIRAGPRAVAAPARRAGRPR